MENIIVRIIGKCQRIKAESRSNHQVNLYFKEAYEEGDFISIIVNEVPGFYWIQLDEAKGSSLVYLTGDFRYSIPFGEKAVCISPKAFRGESHLINVRKARDYELKVYRNLALNVNDQHGNPKCFPHAWANVETRGESVFAAFNAIDGVTATTNHGSWPYGSWGINQNPEAEFTLEFGRTVAVDRIVIYNRADFPHDNWWVSMTITFSDESQKVLETVRTAYGQEFVFEKRNIEWLKINQLIKADDPSPFPALTQIEVYGVELEKE
jgi:hypothetical protein